MKERTRTEEEKKKKKKKRKKKEAHAQTGIYPRIEPSRCPSHEPHANSAACPAVFPMYASQNRYSM